MGLFFRNKKNKPEEKTSKQPQGQNVKEVGLNAPVGVSDMISLIKTEQEELMNPFSDEKNDAVPMSVAKRYGSKYVSMKGQQLASSKVVDIRSYVKPVEKPTTAETKEKTAVEKELEQLKDEEKEEQSARSSFFDELLKSIEEENEEDDAPSDEILPIPEPEPVKVVEPVGKKAVSKAPTIKKKKKKSVDIDIISGDFGGSDII